MLINPLTGQVFVANAEPKKPPKPRKKRGGLIKPWASTDPGVDLIYSPEEVEGLRKEEEDLKRNPPVHKPYVHPQDAKKIANQWIRKLGGINDD